MLFNLRIYPEAGDVAEVVQYLPSKYKALSSNSSITTKKKIMS
jgi:hypothetical protein